MRARPIVVAGQDLNVRPSGLEFGVAIAVRDGRHAKLSVCVDLSAVSRRSACGQRTTRFAGEPYR